MSAESPDRRDKARQGPPLRSQRESNEQAPAPKSRDYSRASRALLYAGIGLLFIVIALILLQTAEGSKISNFISQPLVMAVVSVVVVVFGATVLIVNYWPRKKEPAIDLKKDEFRGGTEGLPADSREIPLPGTFFPPGGKGQRLGEDPFRIPSREELAEMRARSAKAKRTVIVCRLCPETSGEFSNWIDLFEHLESHVVELKALLAELPGKEFADQLISQFFIEIEEEAP